MQGALHFSIVYSLTDAYMLAARPAIGRKTKFFNAFLQQFAWTGRSEQCHAIVSS